MMWPISIQQNFFAHLRAHSSEYVDVDIRRIGIAASKTGQSPTQMGYSWIFCFLLATEYHVSEISRYTAAIQYDCPGTFDFL